MRTQADVEKTRAVPRATAIAGFAHEARNLLTALWLYSELLAEPGVLAKEHEHYAQDLNVLAATGSRLLEDLKHWEGPGPGSAVGEEAGSGTKVATRLSLITDPGR